jgi:hypothetical protein
MDPIWWLFNTIINRNSTRFLSHQQHQMKASRFDSFGMIIPESDLQRIDYLEILVGEVFVVRPIVPRRKSTRRARLVHELKR